MSAEVRQEELEVLQSILDQDVQSISDDELTVRIEPEEGSSIEPMVLLLRVNYTPTYPDELPDLHIEVQEGSAGAEEDSLTEEDKEMLLQRLRETGEESLGMSMVYTLAMQLKESLTELLVAKASAREMEEQAAMLKVEEEEYAAIKGTPVTAEAFLAWKRKFDVEMRDKRKREGEDAIRALPPKERKEREGYEHRLTGRAIFERKRGPGEEVEEEGEDDGADYLDISKYDREERKRQRAEEEEEEEKGLVLSDSD